jgi:hypothetical protein
MIEFMFNHIDADFYDAYTNDLFIDSPNEDTVRY